MNVQPVDYGKGNRRIRKNFTVALTFPVMTTVRNTNTKIRTIRLLNVY
jgi:hypothetical protein